LPDEHAAAIDELDISKIALGGRQANAPFDPGNAMLAGLVDDGGKQEATGRESAELRIVNRKPIVQDGPAAQTEMGRY
jgi:hypothetical protein